jgi:hypothetical protein
MGEDFSVPAQWIAGVALGVMLNVTSARLPARWADPLLRWGWFGVFLYFTYLVMSLNFIQRKLIPLAGSPFRSYIMAGVIGAVVALGYWAVIIRLHNNLIVQIDPPNSSKQEAMPMLAPVVSEPMPSTTPVRIPESAKAPSKMESQPKPHNQNSKQSSAVNQTMTNSPAGIQAGRDVNIGQRPSPPPTKEDKKP